MVKSSDHRGYLHRQQYLLPKLLAILGAELVGAFGAFQRRVGLIPEAFRVDQNAKLPNEEGKHRHYHKGDGIEAAHKDQRREHHQVIPVEDPAGGAAAGTHQQPEGTPDQHTDQVAHIEAHTDQKKNVFVDQLCEIQNADDCDQRGPKKKYLVCRLGGGLNVALQSISVDLVPDGSEPVGKQLLRAKGNGIFNGDDLQKHIDHPHHPKNVEDGKLLKKVHSL